MGNNGNRRKRPSGATASKEAFFIQVAGDGDTPQYFDVSDKIGKPMPFTRPTATLALRVTDQVISLSLLMVSNRTRSNLAERPLEIPNGPLARLERKSRSHRGLRAGQLVVEMDGTEHRLRVERDGAGVATFSHESDDTDPVLFQIPRGGPKLTIYMYSEAAERPLAISSMGARYPGKPGSTDSLLRAVSMVVFSLSQLLEFRVLTGIETVDVPPAPARWDSQEPSQPLAEGDAVVEVPVRLYSGSPPMPAGAGQVNVRVDLDNANPSTGKLLLHLDASEELAEVFGPYRAQMERSVSHLLSRSLGDADIADIAVEIVLGGLDQGSLDRLNEALQAISVGLDLTETQYRLHGT